VPVVGIGFKIDEKNLADNFNRLKAAYDDGLNQFKSIGDKIAGTIPKLPEAGPLLPSESLQKTLDGIDEFQAKYEKAVESITNAFNQTLGPAIDTVFSAIENGENVIASLGQAFKRLITDLIKTTIKAAALAAIISAVTGTPFATNFKLASGFGGAGGGGGLKIGGAAAPTFGGSAAFTGGLQLAGQVVFTQRGTDLVGVLNNQNARINRVG
jgi:hypothetical protein